MKSNDTAPQSSGSPSTLSRTRAIAVTTVVTLGALLMTACSSTSQVAQQRHSAEAKFSRAYAPQTELDQKPKQIHGSMLEAQHKLTDASSSYDYDANAVFLVDEQGIPREIQCTNASSEAVARAAIAEISQWRFNPATKDGKPTAAKVAVAFTSTKPKLHPVANLRGPGPQPVNY